MNLPLIEVMLLGLLAALNPCQIAISMAALAGVVKKDNARGLWFYTAGRVLAYSLLAWAILLAVDGSEQAAEALKEWFQTVEWLVPWALVAVALFFLWRGAMPCRHHESCHDSGRIIKHVGPRGALLLGMALALAFCPESAVFYFGMMLPLCIANNHILLFPLAYAVAAAVPVLIMGCLYERVQSLAAKLGRTLFYTQRLVNLFFALLLGVLAVIIWLE